MSKKTRRLTVRKTYEPNRLADTQLISAYEMLVPSMKLSKRDEKNNSHINKASLSKLGGHIK